MCDGWEEKESSGHSTRAFSKRLEVGTGQVIAIVVKLG